MKPSQVAIVILAVLAVLITAGCLVVINTKTGKPTPETNQAIGVTTTFYPLAEFARAVGSDLVQVTALTPPGAEPHEYEPTAQDLIKIRNSQLFIINGSGLDAWGEKIAPDVVSHGTTVINMADDVQRMESQNNEEVASAQKNQWDPHYWLNPIIASQEVDAIAGALAHIDPTNKNIYLANAKKYNDELSQLDQDYQTGLKNCASRTVVTTHAAFGYLAKQYNLQTIAVAGLSPNAEPTPQHLVAISQTMKNQNIQYIFFETLASPRLAQIIAQETGAQTLVFNPIEGLTKEEQAQGKNYLAIMRDNLHNLRIALSCQ